jgi:ABC-2 type transport system ATP-binding protein
MSPIEMPHFAGKHTLAGNRIVATVPADTAGPAATWANDLQRAGRIEEFSLTPATLEDAYVALVGDPGTAPASIKIDHQEGSDVRAA